MLATSANEAAAAVAAANHTPLIDDGKDAFCILIRQGRQKIYKFYLDAIQDLSLSLNLNSFSFQIDIFSASLWTQLLVQ